MSSAPRLAPSRVNWTPATATLSEAFAETGVVPETLAPAAGALTRDRGRGGVGRRRSAAAHRRGHVGGDLGRRQGPVVDAHLVDAPVGVLAPDRVAADPKRQARGLDGAGRGGLGHLDAVLVEAQLGVVVGEGQVGPGAGGERRADPGHPVGAGAGAGHDLALGAGAGGVGIEGVDQAARLLLQDRGAPGADRVQLHPGLEGHAGGEIERVGVGHRDVVVDPVEVDRAADLAGGGAGGGAGDRAGVVRARGVGDRGAGGLLEAVGAHQAGGAAGRRWRRVTPTAAEVVVLPAASRAIARRVWAPLVAVVVFQETE